MRLRNLLVKNLYTLSSYKYAGELSLFASSLVISRYLKPYEYGLISIATIFYGFLGRFTDVGLTETVIREKHTPSFFAHAHVIFLLKGALMGIVMAGLAYPVAYFFHEPILVSICFGYAIILLLYALPKAMIAQAKHRGDLTWVARGEFYATGIQIMGSILLARAGFSYWALILPHVLLPFFYFFYYRRRVPIPWHAFYHTPFRASWNVARPMLMHFGMLRFIQYLEGNTDTFWVGRLFGTGTLGVYNRAYSLVNMPINLVIQQVNTVLLSGLRNASPTTHLPTEIHTFIRLLAGLFFWPLMVFTLFPNHLAVWLWGADWAAVGRPLGILCIALIPQVFIQSAAALYVIYHKEKLMLINGILSCITIVSAITVGAIYSVDVMMYSYLAALLFISLPLTCYLGYHIAFGFSLRQIIYLGGDYLLGATALFILKWTHHDDWLVYPIILMMLPSLITLLKFITSIKNKNRP